MKPRNNADYSLERYSPDRHWQENFLFIGHPEAGQRSAVIYSVLGSCRRLGINPTENLQALFERLPKSKTSEIKSLAPAAWLKAKHEAQRQSPKS